MECFNFALKFIMITYNYLLPGESSWTIAHLNRYEQKMANFFYFLFLSIAHCKNCILIINILKWILFDVKYISGSTSINHTHTLSHQIFKYYTHVCVLFTIHYKYEIFRKIFLKQSAGAVHIYIDIVFV